MSAARVLPLDFYDQEPSFIAVQERMRGTWPYDWTWVERAVLEVAREGSFSADDVMDHVGRGVIPEPNVIGSVLGCLRRCNVIRTVGRTKARHPEAKGRWVNVFALVEEAS